MGTAGGEPGVLLNALKPMLGTVGDIKTPHEVFRVVGMMKDAEKLMSRCVYLNILKATCRQAADNVGKRETLDKFLSSGGWAILNKWLIEFTKAENFPVLLELIEVLKLMPVTVELLKQGNTGKIMKSMTKLAHSDVKKNASVMIKRWKTMIRDQQDTKKKPHENDTVEPRREMTKESKDPVSETSGFMDALNIHTTAIPPVKKKRRNSFEGMPKKTTLPLDEILKAPLPGEVRKPEQEPEPEPMESSESDEAGPFVFHNPAVEAANLALAEDKTTGVLIDEGSLARRKNRKKKNISWAPDEDLVEISYYELMEGEQKGGHAESFNEARQHELMLEKQALRHARGLGPDNMTEKIDWKCLIPVDNSGIPNFVPGEKSREKFIQAEREKTVLAYIFLSKQSLPDFPSEPDFNAEEHNKTSRQPTLIPHDEEQTILPPAKQSVAQPAPTTNTPNIITSQTLPQVPSSQVPANAPSENVQNIMAQLMKSNLIPQPPQPPQQPPQPPPQQPQTNGAVRPPIPPRNMVPPPPGGPGLCGPPPGMRPPYPANLPPPNMAPMNNNTNNGFRPPPARPALMDAPPPHNPENIRFQGVRGGFNARGGYANGRGGPAGPGGPPLRHNWNGGPPPPPPPPNNINNKNSNKLNGNWDDPKLTKNNFRDENFNEDFNEPHDSYIDNDFRNDNRRFFGGGEERGRGRGFWQRGNNRPHRGRGNNRGGPRNDYINRDNNRDNRGNYGNTKDWNGYDENRNSRRNNEWNNRDDGFHGNGGGPIRGRHHRNEGRGRPIRDERAR